MLHNSAYMQSSKEYPQLQSSHRHGFTIVELLVVIVVIGILAAITIVSFSGIQRRATNASRISAASQAAKLVRSYVVTYGNYPLAGADGRYCATRDNLCSDYSGTQLVNSNTALLTELSKLGVSPASIPRQSGIYFGLYWDYYISNNPTDRVIEGDANRDLLLMYSLEGDTQPCGNSVVVQSGASNYIASTTGYTSSGSGRTQCWIGV